MEKSNLNSRREFLQKMVAATAVAGLYPYLNSADGASPGTGLKRQTAQKGAWKDRPYGWDLQSWRTGYT